MSASPIHDWEQFTAMARDFAGTVSTYFKTLVAAGLTRAEALELALGWQNTTIASMIVNTKKAES